MGENKDRKAKQEQGDEKAPQVYAVQKDLTGWRFSQRDFLAVAGAATAAAVAGAAAGCGPVPPTPTATPSLTDTPAPTAVPQLTLSPREKVLVCADVKAHAESVCVLAVNPDGTLLVSASTNGTINCDRCRKGHKREVEALAVSLDGTLLASASEDKTMVCVCNCVAGGYAPSCSCVGHTSGHYWYPC